MKKKSAAPIVRALLFSLALGVSSPCPLLAGNTPMGQQQSAKGQKVQGVVVDENGEPLIGVTVQVKGRQGGTITDFDGNFSLDAPSNATLVFSYVGYSTLELKASQAQKVQMKTDAIGLDEFVKIGYGSVKKRDLTGAISQVKSEDITVSPTTSAMEGLQGKIAGLDITRESGQAGATPKILLRGNRSLSAFSSDNKGADCSPLFVIDGIAGGNIEDLNPNDIESIEVMKDASSTAIYGSAGANGVILVTTKQAKAGKTVVDFNAYVGVNAFPSYPDTYTGEAWLGFLNEGYAARYGEYLDINSADAKTKQDAIAKLFNSKGLTQGAIDAYNQGKFINWKDQVLHTGMQQNYNISIRGGSEKAKGYMSAGYQEEKGLYKNDYQDQLTFRAGADFQINKIVKVGFQSSMNYRNRESRQSRLSKTLNAYPLGTLYDEQGNLNKYPVEDMKSYINILADDQPYAYRNNTKHFALNIAPYVEITPFKGFLFKSIINGSYGHSRQGVWDGLDTYMKLSGSSPNIRSASLNNNMSYSYTWQNVASYNITIAQKHDLGFTALMEFSKSRSEKAGETNENFSFDEQLWYNMSAGTNPQTTSSYSETTKLSYALRANYSFLGRYLLSASIRWDGASQLYKKWDTFPAVSLGWRLSDEKFMTRAKSWLDNLKLRAGYGVTGNSNIPAYVSLTNVIDSPNLLDLGGGKVKSYILTSHVANYDLTWEKSYNWNVGLDFAVLGGRIDGSVEWYSTNSENVIWSRPLPTAFGTYNAKTTYGKYSNIAKINNQGWEVTVNSRNIQNKNFKWGTTFTFAINSEKLKEINMGNNTTVNELIALNLFMDQPVNTYYGYKKIGIWQTGEENQAICFGDEPGKVKLDVPGLVWDPNYTYVVEKTVKTETGESKVEKVTYQGAYYKAEENNADGTHNYYTASNPYSVSTNDKQILGHATPKWTIGLNNKFEFFNFDITVMMTMRWGQMVKGDLLGFSSNDNQPTCYDYWTPTNATNAYPRPNWGGSMTTAQKESLSYVDGSFFKIKNITLGYNVPQKALKKVKMTKCRIYATITNPVIVQKSEMLKGMDPETNASDKYPLYKTIVLGVNLSF